VCAIVKHMVVNAEVVESTRRGGGLVVALVKADSNSTVC